MITDQDKERIWQQRWHGSESRERLTFLGKLMFKAKSKAIKVALSHIEVGGMLEVGCGLGHTLSVFKKQGIECEGIDISPTAIQVCRKKGLNVRLQKLKDVANQYDLISSDGMLEHFLHFEPYAVDLMRISRRYVMLIQPNHGSIAGKSLVYLAELLRGDSNVFEYNYRIQDFIDVFEKNGFRNVKNCPVFFDVFRLLIFEREMA